MEYVVAGHIRLLALCQELLEGGKVGENLRRVGFCPGEHEAQSVITRATVVVVAVARVLREAVDAGIVSASP